VADARDSISFLQTGSFYGSLFFVNYLIMNYYEPVH
jgi:hypothetical protein